MVDATLNAEAMEILGEFSRLLRGPTGDGQAKRDPRRVNQKPLWKVDPDHESAMLRHFDRWVAGEVEDPDSGCHPLVHVAWRALALAAQSEHAGEPGWL